MAAKAYLFLCPRILVCFLAAIAVADPGKIPPGLIGTWNYESLTALKNGKPFGTAHLKPGQISTTFNADGTWVVRTTVGTHELNGSYEIQGQDLDMKFSDGKPYNHFRFSIEHDGKMLTLKNKNEVITASRE